MKLDTKDTVITISKRKVEDCSFEQLCENEIQESNKDTLIDSFLSQEQESSSTEVIVEKIEKTNFKNEVVLTSFDSIKPCSESFIKQGDNRLSNEFILIPEHNSTRKENEVDLFCLSLTFGFLVFISVKYAINSASSWYSLCSEIKEIVNS